MTTRAPYSTRAPRVDTGKPGSLRARLLAFFKANPDEELTPRQIGDKFGVSPQRVGDVVTDLTQAQLLERVNVVRLPSKGIAT